MIPFFVVTEDSQSQRIAHEGVAERKEVVVWVYTHVIPKDYWLIEWIYVRSRFF